MLETLTIPSLHRIKFLVFRWWFIPQVWISERNTVNRINKSQIAHFKYCQPTFFLHARIFFLSGKLVAANQLSDDDDLIPILCKKNLTENKSWITPYPNYVFKFNSLKFVIYCFEISQQRFEQMGQNQACIHIWKCLTSHIKLWTYHRDMPERRLPGWDSHWSPQWHLLRWLSQPSPGSV